MASARFAACVFLFLLASQAVVDGVTLSRLVKARDRRRVATLQSSVPDPSFVHASLYPDVEQDPDGEDEQRSSSLVQLHEHVRDFDEKTAGFEGEFGGFSLVPVKKLLTPGGSVTGITWKSNNDYKVPITWGDGYIVAKSADDAVGHAAHQAGPNIMVTVDNSMERPFGVIELISSHYPVDGDDSAYIRVTHKAFACFATALDTSFAAKGVAPVDPINTASANYVQLDTILTAYSLCIKTAIQTLAHTYHVLDGKEDAWEATIFPGVYTVRTVDYKPSDFDWFVGRRNTKAIPVFPSIQVNYGYPFNRIGCAWNPHDLTTILPAGRANYILADSRKAARTIAQRIDTQLGRGTDATEKNKNARSLLTLYMWQVYGYCKGREAYEAAITAAQPDNRAVWEGEVAHKNLFGQMPKLDLLKTRDSLVAKNAIAAADWGEDVFTALNAADLAASAQKDWFKFSRKSPALAGDGTVGLACFKALVPKCFTTMLANGLNPGTRYTIRPAEEDPHYSNADWDITAAPLGFDAKACARNLLPPARFVPLKQLLTPPSPTDNYGVVMERRAQTVAPDLAEEFATEAHLGAFLTALRDWMNDQPPGPIGDACPIVPA